MVQWSSPYFILCQRRLVRETEIGSRNGNWYELSRVRVTEGKTTVNIDQYMTETDDDRSDTDADIQ